MSKDRYLCIGGPHDGQWITANGEPFKVLLQHPAASHLDMQTSPTADPLNLFTRHTYYRHDFWTGDERNRIYRSEYLSVTDVIARLIHHYHPPKEE
jgi:hypothetical protein